MGPFRSTISRFRYTTYTIKVGQKIGNALNDPKLNLKHLTVKSTLYTLNTYPRGPNFDPFRSMVSRFRDTTCTRWAKIGNALNDPQMNLST